jgi:hypothetical protein
MDFIEGKQRPTSDWIAQQTDLLADAAKPSAQLLLMVVPPVQKLLVATQNGTVR